ncbi:MAG: element excision factor XisH family protein [Bacteroidota bacterium]
MLKVYFYAGYIPQIANQFMAKDKIHEIVIRALIKDGWIITHDPYVLKMKPGQSIDVGAEKIIIAERGIEKIAVEIKSFLTSSKLYKFYEALGQFMSYRIGLRSQEPDRILYLAMPEKVYKQLMEYTTVPETIEEANLKIVTIDLVNENIVAWME